MPFDIRQHPDAPDLETLGDIVVDPIPREEIIARREDGDVLLEDNIRERDDVDAYPSMETGTQPGGQTAFDENVGTILYRLVQLFGTPQFPEYTAGDDISHRTDTTFKYLFRATLDEENDDLPGEWLFTVFDWRVDLGVAIARWGDEGEAITSSHATALTTLLLAYNITTEPVECVYEDIWF